MGTEFGKRNQKGIDFTHQTTKASLFLFCLYSSVCRHHYSVLLGFSETVFLRLTYQLLLAQNLLCLSLFT